MSPVHSVDVSGVPTSGHGPKSPLWWGTIGFMIVEGTSLALCGATYIYLSRNFEAWPPPSIPEPSLLVPTITVALMLISCITGIFIDRYSKQKDRDALLGALVVCAVIKTVAIATRIYEFDSLNVAWYDTAYGSAAWFTLVFHTTLLAAELVEGIVFAVIFWMGPVHDDHYEDADEITFYSWFLFLAWLPLYFLIYFSPRWF